MNLDFSALDEIYSRFINFLPTLIGAIIFIISCIIVYMLTLFVIKKLLKFSKIEFLNQKINDNEVLKKSNIKINFENIIIQTIKLILILLILVIGADFFNLNMVSQQIGNLINYLPQFISAVLIFTLGFYLGNKIKELLRNILKSIDFNGSNIISNIVFYLIIVFVSITALNQAGINTDIITSNLSIIMGAFLLTFTIAFGLGSRDVIYKLLLGFYTNKNLAIGQKIIYNGKKGMITGIDNITLTLQTEEEKILIPIENISKSEIIIINE